MSGWKNLSVSKCLGARISCSHNVWVSKRGVSKCPGVEMSGAEMSENLIECDSMVSVDPSAHVCVVLCATWYSLLRLLPLRYS